MVPYIGITFTIRFTKKNFFTFNRGYVWQPKNDHCAQSGAHVSPKTVPATGQGRDAFGSALFSLDLLVGWLEIFPKSWFDGDFAMVEK